MTLCSNKKSSVYISEIWWIESIRTLWPGQLSLWAWLVKLNRLFSKWNDKYFLFQWWQVKKSIPMLSRLCLHSSISTEMGNCFRKISSEWWRIAWRGDLGSCQASRASRGSNTVWRRRSLRRQKNRCDTIIEFRSNLVYEEVCIIWNITECFCIEFYHTLYNLWLIFLPSFLFL